MDIENISLYAAFQSEKTGSTPVGSAMMLLGFLVGSADVCQFPPKAFANVGSLRVLPLADCRLRHLSLVRPLADHGAAQESRYAT
jgi:hypothetical protein